jgi:hypothetical protein
MGFGKAAPFFVSVILYGIIVGPSTSRRFVNELSNRYERSTAILSWAPAVNITDMTELNTVYEKSYTNFEPTVKSSWSIEESC